MSNAALTPEEYFKQHQKGFRAAFDYLNAHFPPEDDPEWWAQAAKDASDATVAIGETRISVCLIAGVYDYLEWIWKERRNSDGETEH